MNASRNSSIKRHLRQTNEFLTEFTLDVLKEPTERDKQIKIGASNASRLCDRCLADDMLGVRHGASRWWMGAVVGTAIHNYLEERLNTHEGLRAKYPDVMTEHKMVIGSIKDYGEIKSTSDIYFPSRSLVVDWKTTSEKHWDHIQTACEQPPAPFDSNKLLSTREKIFGYENQLMMYGLGYENQGFEVDTCSLVFIRRDGLEDDDIYVYSLPYNRDRALALVDRAQRLWAWLQRNSPDELDSSPNCWYCNTQRHND